MQCILANLIYEVSDLLLISEYFFIHRTSSVSTREPPLQQTSSELMMIAWNNLYCIVYTVVHNHMHIHMNSS